MGEGVDRWGALVASVAISSCPWRAVGNTPKSAADTQNRAGEYTSHRCDLGHWVLRGVERPSKGAACVWIYIGVYVYRCVYMGVCSGVCA